MTNEEFEQLKGTVREFNIRDIFIPDPVAVLSELHEGETLTGTVVDWSDDARNERAAFLVIQTDTLSEPCIVAFERTRPSKDGEGS